MEKLIIDFNYDTLIASRTIDENSRNYQGYNLKIALDVLSKNKITNYIIDNKNLILIYNNAFKVEIKNFKDIFSSDMLRAFPNMKPLLKQINTFIAKKKTNGKHVVKRNSKIGKAIITTALAGIMFVGTISALDIKVDAKVIDKQTEHTQVVTLNPMENVVNAPNTYANPSLEANTSEVVSVTTPEVTPEVTPQITPEVTPAVTPSPIPTAKVLNDETETKEIKNINMSFEDRTSSSKAVNCKANYEDVITEMANKYGNDPAIMIAIATQERGTHSSVMDEGGGVGLMQLQYEVWGPKQNSDGTITYHNITAYNYETGKKETLTITDQNIRDLKTNIQISNMYFQNCRNLMNQNIPASLLSYNWGGGQAQSKLKDYSYDIGEAYNDIINDYTNTQWTSLFNVPMGDGTYNNYANLVLSYVNKDHEIINYKLNDNGEKIPVIFHISNSYQKDLTK